LLPTDAGIPFACTWNAGCTQKKAILSLLPSRRLRGGTAKLWLHTFLSSAIDGGARTSSQPVRDKGSH